MVVLGVTSFDMASCFACFVVAAVEEPDKIDKAGALVEDLELVDTQLGIVVAAAVEVVVVVPGTMACRVCLVVVHKASCFVHHAVVFGMNRLACFA